jgi:hypothetical protein
MEAPYLKKAEGRKRKAEGGSVRGIVSPQSLPATQYLQWGIVTLDPNPSPEALGRRQEDFPCAFFPLHKSLSCSIGVGNALEGLLVSK